MIPDTRQFPLAVVTGAAHRLGRAIALGLAAEGYAIGLHYHRSQTAARQTAADIRDLGVPALLYQADLAQPEEIQTLFEAVGREPYPLKVLVNSAAVMQRGNLGDLAVADWNTSMDVNLRAPWLCSRLAAGLMQPGGGVIINISDTGARKTWSGFPAYAVTKAGLEMLTRLLARTYAPGIRVNAVAPGLVLPAEGMPADEWQRLAQRLPLKRAGTPQDIVEAVLYLIRSEYITGDILTVDGGNQLL